MATSTPGAKIYYLLGDENVEMKRYNPQNPVAVSFSEDTQLQVFTSAPGMKSAYYSYKLGQTERTLLLSRETQRKRFPPSLSVA